MALQRQAAADTIISDINITPLTDVMLVLLIIFMVTATFFVAEPAMQVDLPPAVSSELVTKGDGEITVIVNREGALFVDEQPVAPERLTQALMDAARSIAADRKLVVVRGDREAAYGQIIWIMDSARLVGLRHVSLATVPTESESGPPQHTGA
jgi:biopolymer transport protein TolR